MPPAAPSMAVPFLHFKGFQSLQAYRISHHLWNQGRKDLAFHLQGRITLVYGVDFHPAARIGSGKGQRVMRLGLIAQSAFRNVRILDFACWIDKSRAFPISVIDQTSEF